MNACTTRPTGEPGYRLDRWLEAGNAASIYAAMEQSSERPLAVKIFHRADVAALARIEQRLQKNAGLTHRNIVDVLEIGRTADGRLFYSMPLLQGFEQARHDLAGKPRRIADVLRGLLQALDHAHRCGIVHGNIKPSNVLFDKQGHAQLADFGIAQCLAESGLSQPDASEYLSPEQSHGEPADARSDLYGVGMLAFDLVARTAPAPGRDASAAVATTTARSASQPLLSVDAWKPWLDRALASSPEQRFQTAAEMADALTALLAQSNGSHPVAPAKRWHAPKWALPAAVAAAAIMVLVVGWAMSERRPAPAGEAASMPALTASVETPALPATVAPPPAAVPAVSSTTLLAQRVQALVATGDSLRASGHLFSPSSGNAESRYLAALKLDPGNREATAGIDALLATLRHRLDKSWADPVRTPEILDMLQQGDELTSHAHRSARRDWRDFHDQLQMQVGNAVVQAAHAHDLQKVVALEPLATALPATYPGGFDLAEAKRIASTPVAGDHLRDPRGPRLVYVPAAGNAPAFAIARVEVTRADYATFAHATHRPAAKCRAAHNPLSWLRHLSWQSPGFAQDGDHPAVCVSWDDAAAYATWLSNTTGEPYRLPNSREWLRAAHGMPDATPCQRGNVDDTSRPGRLDTDRWPCSDGAAETAPVGHYAASAIGVYDLYGNVSEWLTGGSPGSRPFRGLSWRDGSHQTPFGNPGTADSDVGYTNVGFRVVRVIDAAHAAPPSASLR